MKVSQHYCQYWGALSLLTQMPVILQTASQSHHRVLYKLMRCGCWFGCLLPAALRIPDQQHAACMLVAAELAGGRDLSNVL